MLQPDLSGKWVGKMNSFLSYKQVCYENAVHLQEKLSMNLYIDLNKRNCIIKVAFVIFFFSFIPFMHA